MELGSFIIGLVSGAVLMGAVWAFMSRGNTAAEEELARLRQLRAEMHQEQEPEGGTRVDPARIAQEARRAAEKRAAAGITVRRALMLQTPDGDTKSPIEGTWITIGRGLINEIIVEDARLSRQHAGIRYKSGRSFISDLGSTNGTKVNGVAVNTDQVLKDGDVISFGGFEMTYHEAPTLPVVSRRSQDQVQPTTEIKPPQ